MESFIEQYFEKCENCEEIGVRVENRNPRNQTRFAKPDLTVKRYDKETTCPDYIVNGLDGIHRREVQRGWEVEEEGKIGREGLWWGKKGSGEKGGVEEGGSGKGKECERG